MTTHNLFAFGDSHTYGFGLPDIWDPAIPNYYSVPTDYDSLTPYILRGSKLVWANVLAEKLNQRCYNYAISGSSNKEILWQLKKVISANMIHPGDTVVIQWAFFGRHCIISGPSSQDVDNIDRIWHTSASEREVTYYTRYYVEYDAQIETWNRIHYAHLLLAELGVKSYHMLSDSEQTEMPRPYIAHNVHILKTTIADVEDQAYNNNWPRAADDRHQGPEAHMYLGNKFYEMIKG